MQTIWSAPTVGSAKYGANNIVKPVVGGPEGAWYYPAYYESTSFYVVDRADDYDWVIFVTFGIDGNFMNVLSTTPENTAAKARGIELANQYGFYVHETIQNSSCAYDAFWREFSKSF
jgi:hypothetical protein